MHSRNGRVEKRAPAIVCLLPPMASLPSSSHSILLLAGRPWELLQVSCALGTTRAVGSLFASRTFAPIGSEAWRYIVYD